MNSQATTGPDCWGETYSDDTFGNLLAITPSQCGSFSLSVGVDGNNHIISGGYAYDGAGNMTQDASGLVYNFDAENRLTRATGMSGGPYTYTYDGSSRRVEKSNGVTGTLYWGGLAETDLSGNITSEYVFFAGRRIARRDASGNVFFYNADSLGSTRTVTDANGNICYDAEFTPYGTEFIHANSCSQNYKFTGYERDSESGLDYAEARYYNQRIGRFMSVDPMAGDIRDPQTLNRYAYVRNNPVNLTDPSGLWSTASWFRGDQTIQSNPYTKRQCSVDGAITACRMAFSLMGAGAAVWCPDNDCSNVIQVTDAGITVRMPTGHLVMQCLASGSTGWGCSWSFWSRRFIQVGSGNYLGPNDSYLIGDAQRLAILSQAYDKSMFSFKTAAAMEGIGLAGILAGAAGAALDAGLAESDAEIATITVGRWMSQEELEAMQASNQVQESLSSNGITSVITPPNPEAFSPPPGSVWVEFDVPADSVHFIDPVTGWAKIFGPTSVPYGEYYGITEMPTVTNIRVP